MNYPDIKTYHENKRQHYMAPWSDRPHFLGRSALDMRWLKKRPPANIAESDLIYKLEVGLPGFNKEEISITLHGDVLTVRAERKSESCPLTEYLVREFDHDVVERTFKLGQRIGQEKIEAVYKNGLLEISFRDILPLEANTVEKIHVA